MPIEPESYDLVIYGGRVLDPANSMDDPFDVAVKDGIISAVQTNIDTSNTKQIIDATGYVVTPGLIDLHTHAAAGIRKATDEEFLVTPDVAGVNAGITTIVDAGSTGALNIGGLINHVVPQSSTRVLVLINVGSTGVANLPEVRTEEDINHEAAVEAIKSSPAIIGTKVRMVTPGITTLGIELPKAAKAIADEADGLMMAHIGDIAGQDPAAPKLTAQLLTEILTGGDIVTHSLSGEVGALLASGSLIDEAQEARCNGVYFDVGVGGGNFSFESARQIIGQGFIPDTISSDITAASRFDGPVFSLTECMGKMMALGIAFEDTIRMTTLKPAEIIGMQDEIGSLSVGTGADISILDLVDGKFTFHERTGPGAVGTQAILPILAVRAGKPMPIDYGPRPSGWLPDQEE